MNSNLPLGKILDVERKPIINKKYIWVFIVGFLFGISVGIWMISYFEGNPDEKDTLIDFETKDLNAPMVTCVD